MKKLLFLLLAFVTITMHAQTANGSETPFEAIQVTNPQTVTTATGVVSIGADGTNGKIDPVLLPLSTAAINAINTAGNSYVKKSGDAFTYSSDFDDLLSQDASFNIRKRTLRPEATRLTIAISSIWCWGDSLTAADGSTGSYLYGLNALTNFTMVNKGVGGETSTSVKNRFIADVADYDKTVIIWVGRNNFTSPATVKADIATMIASLTHTRYLVLGVINGNYADEYVNTTKWTTINTLNADLKTLYGKKFLDIRPYLVSLYNPSIPQDVTDNNNDVYPTSLRIDDIHPNPAGALKIAEYVNRYLGILYEKEGYLQSKDFSYYFELYNPLHKFGDETSTGIKSTTNTTTPFSNGYRFTNNGGASSKSVEINVGGISAKGIDLYLTANGFGIYGSNPGGGQLFRGDNTLNGNVFHALNSGAGGIAARLVNASGVTGASQALRIDNFGGAVGIFGVNPSTGIFNSVTNQSTGVLNIFESSTASTGDLVRFTKNGTTRTKFDSDSNLFFVTAPQVNPATYNIGVVSTVAGATSGRFETIPSTTFATTANPVFTGNGSIGNNWTVGGDLTMTSGAISFSGDGLGITNRPTISRTGGRMLFKSDLINPFFYTINTDNLTTTRTRIIRDADGEETISLSGSATLDFPSTLANSTSTLTITSTGAVVGDVVSIGTPVPDAGCLYYAYVSASNTITVRFINMTIMAVDPASATFKTKILK